MQEYDFLSKQSAYAIGPLIDKPHYRIDDFVNAMSHGGRLIAVFVRSKVYEIMVADPAANNVLLEHIP